MREGARSAMGRAPSMLIGWEMVRRARRAAVALTPPRGRRRNRPRRFPAATLSQFWERVWRERFRRAGQPIACRTLRWARHASPLRFPGVGRGGCRSPVSRESRVRDARPAGPRTRRAECDGAGSVETGSRWRGTAGGSAALGTAVSCLTQRAARPPREPAVVRPGRAGDTPKQAVAVSVDVSQERKMSLSRRSERGTSKFSIQTRPPDEPTRRRSPRRRRRGGRGRRTSGA